MLKLFEARFRIGNGAVSFKISHLPQEPRRDSDPPGCAPAQRIERVMNHMLQHLDKPLCISNLCKIAGWSPAQFCSVFKSVTGRSPIHYFIRLRIHRACDLLRDRNLLVKDAAALLGYDDPLYFSRVFKSVTGVAPREYQLAVGHPPRLKFDAGQKGRFN